MLCGAWLCYERNTNHRNYVASNPKNRFWDGNRASGEVRLISVCLTKPHT